LRSARCGHPAFVQHPWASCQASSRLSMATPCHWSMYLNPSNEDVAALTANTTGDDRYWFSGSIRTLKVILGKLRPKPSSPLTAVFRSRPYRPAVRRTWNRQASRANRGRWCQRHTEQPSPPDRVQRVGRYGTHDLSMFSGLGTPQRRKRHAQLIRQLTRRRRTETDMRKHPFLFPIRGSGG